MSRTQYLKSLEQKVAASARTINELLQELYETRQRLQQYEQRQADEPITAS